MSMIDDALHEVKMAFVLFANAFAGRHPMAKTTEDMLAAERHGLLATQADSSAVEAKEPHAMPLTPGEQSGGNGDAGL